VPEVLIRPGPSANVVRVGGVNIAVFRTGAGGVFALRDSCPHRGGPLSQGIVHGDRVTCPLHDWVIDLKSGNAVGVDEGCTATFATRIEDGRVSIDVPYVSLQSTGRDPDHALSVDQIAGARMATRHLIELGHRGIYHLAGPQDWIEAEARMRGFLDEMSSQDVPTTAPILGDWTADFGYWAGRELLTVRDFTAIFASNDQMALGLMHAVRDSGLEIPRDISIIGFDDIPEAPHFWPPLTTVRQDFAELGRRCVALLLGDLDPAAADYHGTIVPELIIRGSTGAPPW